jgi:NADPH:quinone reductase-like Zn-dependent oxidoreductase
MKAIVWTRYGPPDGLQLQELAQPIPKDNEVLIKVHATTATAADTEFRRLKLPLAFAVPLRLFLGLRKPTRITILGTEFAGEVVSAGKDVTRYKPGDQVFGYTGLGMGTYAEYLCLSEIPSAMASVMGIKPANVSYPEAAAVVFGGLEALHALEASGHPARAESPDVGAGGSIGTCAVQLARYYGAEVTCRQGWKLEMLVHRRRSRRRLRSRFHQKRSDL